MIYAFYGTLKKGYYNHEFYLKGKTEFIGKGKVYKYLLGGMLIPIAVKTDKENDYIEVEVYRINNRSIIDELDKLERYYYIKQLVDIQMENGIKLKGIIYVSRFKITNPWAHNFEEFLNVQKEVSSS